MKALKSVKKMMFKKRYLPLKKVFSNYFKRVVVGWVVTSHSWHPHLNRRLGGIWWKQMVESFAHISEIISNNYFWKLGVSNVVIYPKDRLRTKNKKALLCNFSIQLFTPECLIDVPTPQITFSIFFNPRHSYFVPQPLPL